MAYILNKLCRNLNIKLSYTNNKIIILSCNCKNNLLSIRTHKIFKGCKKRIANAIIDFYTKDEKREENLKIIKDYADKKFNSKIYKISPARGKFYNKTSKVNLTDRIEENKKNVLTELTISSISKKNTFKDSYEDNEDNSIIVVDDDILEVNIIVNPFNT